MRTAMQLLSNPIDGGLIAGSNSLPTIASLAAKGNNNSLGRINGTIEDFALLPDDSFAVIADGTSTIHLVNVAAKESKKLLSDATSFSCVAVHPRGLRIVAGENSLGKANGSLTFWDTDGLKVISQVEVPKKPTDITYARMVAWLQHPCWMVNATFLMVVQGHSGKRASGSRTIVDLI